MRSRSLGSHRKKRRVLRVRGGVSTPDRTRWTDGRGEGVGAWDDQWWGRSEREQENQEQDDSGNRSCGRGKPDGPGVTRSLFGGKGAPLPLGTESQECSERYNCQTPDLGTLPWYYPSGITPLVEENTERSFGLKGGILLSRRSRTFSRVLLDLLPFLLSPTPHSPTLDNPSSLSLRLPPLLLPPNPETFLCQL